MAKPKLALIPAAQGTSLYSVLPSSGVGDFQFNRSGSATRINSQGLIETVASGVSRLNYPMIDGVVKGCPHHILEPQRLQKVQYSEDFSNSYWNKTGVTVIPNEAISPDGTLNASKLREGTSNSRQEVWKNIGVTTSTNVFSCFFKKGTSRFASIVTSDTTTWNTMVVVDLELGIITETFNGSGFSSVNKIENYGNGWYRLTSSITGVFSGGVIYARIGIRNSGTPTPPPNDSYFGDGTSYIYIWGAMLESGSYPTSYIPNYGTSAGVTRSAETANGSGDAATFNSEQGVLMAEISDFNNDGFRQLTISSGSSSNAISIMNTTTENQVVCYVNNGGVTQASISTILNSTHEFNKIAIKYKLNDFSVYINGFEIGVDTNGTLPTGLNTLNFDTGSGSGNVYGNTKQIQYYDTALNSEDLEKLTSWVSFQEMADGQLYTIE
jgi:hypothetical protein